MDSLGTLNADTPPLFSGLSVMHGTKRHFPVAGWGQPQVHPATGQSARARNKVLARMRVAGLGVIVAWSVLFLAAHVTHLAVHVILGVGITLLVYGALKVQS